MKTLKTISLLALSISMLACKAESKKTPELIAITTYAKPITKNTIKVALLLDTSNSMDGLIDQAKSQLWEIVNELSYAKCEHERPNLNIALYEYGNDGLPQQKGYIRQVSPFTNDLDLISEKLFSLTTNGGNEYCGQVIKTSIDNLDWGNNKNDLKLVFIAGNEPFTQGPVSYLDATTDAKEKDISINTIFCGNYQNGISSKWQEGALLTNGDYMAIDHNQQTVHIATPYDDYILELNIRLNKTYIPYGSQGKRKYEAQAIQDENAFSYGKSNVVSRTISKSSGFYSNSKWDLVDAEQEEDFNYDEVDKKHLPQELQKLSKKELAQYVEKKRLERERIQKEIQEQNKKRKIHIANEKKNNKINNGLENAMLNAIKKQAEKKNYKWDK
ncbi:vWA domain-containing protein [Pseudofulvibacter geojedonensis]|uniref:VWA domain-containing protein n=1 Tax=Pseudofulvibacter geojedonensis TaxID=1123758 RepID=A0ABW3I1C0_9FLAO